MVIVARARFIFTFTFITIEFEQKCLSITHIFRMDVGELDQTNSHDKRFSLLSFEESKRMIKRNSYGGLPSAWDGRTSNLFRLIILPTSAPWGAYHVEIHLFFKKLRIVYTSQESIHHSSSSPFFFLCTKGPTQKRNT